MCPYSGYGLFFAYAPILYMHTYTYHQDPNFEDD